MKMKQLEYLIKIAECGSISKAAQELYISQPSLTKAISSLEEEFHVQLLLRKPRGVELTIEGKSFLHYARSVVTAANALESNFSGQGGADRSRLFIAPASCPAAFAAASAVSASIRSMTASAWVRSICPFKNARRVNSPGPACRNPAANRASSPAVSAAGDPWH